MFGRDFSLSLSLSRCSHFWHAFGLNLKGFFTHFVAISSYLVANFSYFVVVLTHLFAYKRHFLRHCAFLKFLNALFLGFLRLSLRAVCLKTADFVILSVATQRVARRKPQQKNPKNLRYALFMDTSLPLSMTNLGKSLNLIVCHTLMLSKLAMTARLVILSLLQKGEKSKGLKAHLLFLDTSLALSMTRFMTQRVFGMTNSGFCLKITDIFTQILGTKFTNFIRFYGLPRSLCSLAMTARQKFKFSTQNSKHFINSTHFINLTQISSHTQGFFIFLSQVFAQCKLIKNFLQGGHYV